MVNLVLLMSFFYSNARLRCRVGLIIVTITLLILIASKKILSITNGSNMNTNNNYFLDKMNARTKRIREVCSSNVCYAGKCHSLNAQHIYWLRNENIAYCPIFKSATSTWRNRLITLLNQTYSGKVEMIKKDSNKRIRVHDKLIKLGATNPKNHDFVNYINGLPNIRNLTAFMVVRHPFERLVSAYRDKLERNNLEEPFYYNRFGKYFVEKYRKAAIKALGESYFSMENNFGTPMKVLNDRRPNADLPSFWEFSQAVIEHYKIDEHWAPINEYCSVCNEISMKAFRYILKFEKLEDEEERFLKHVRWNLNEEKLESKLNVNQPDDISGKELALLYFSELSEKQIRALYRVYELDFLLFDYTFTIGNIHLPP